MGRHISHTKFAGPLRKLADESPSAFLAEAEGVRDLVQHPGWVFLRDLIDQQVGQLEARIYSEGEPLSAEQYARLAGEVVGIRSLAGAVETVLSKAKVVEEQQRQSADEQSAGG